MLIPGTNIRVDNFELHASDIRYFIYFLTHFHSDHLRGLHHSWNGGTIYTSEMTRRLIVTKYPDLEERVVSLELNQPHWVSTSKNGHEGVTVHLMDANHCPGSVMILIYTGKETILHTGDVRFNEKFLKYRELFPQTMENAKKDGVAIHIDKMIIDNTFCNPAYDFPTQKACFIKILNLIKANNCCRTYFFVYRIGKEELLINLAQNLNTKIVVSEEKLAQMKLLQFDEDLFTTNPDEGWIHLKGRTDLFHMSITQLNQEKPTIFIIPTGFIDKFKKTHPRIHLVNYSSHSSYSQLKEFVKAVRPKKLLFSSFKKDYKYENELIKHYCRDKSSFNFEKDFIDPLGIQTRISKYLKKAPSLKSSQTTVTEKIEKQSQEESKTASQEPVLLKPRKFTEIASFKNNGRITRGVSRGLKFKHDELVEPLRDLESIKKKKKVEQVSVFQRSFSREAISLQSQHSLKSMSSKRGLLLRDGKEVSSASERSGRRASLKDNCMDRFLRGQRGVIDSDIIHHKNRRVKKEEEEEDKRPQQKDIRYFFQRDK